MTDNIFITKNELEPLLSLYSFYNLDNTSYKNLKLSYSDLEELKSYKRIILYRPSISMLDSLKYFDDKQVIIIDYGLVDSIYEKILELKDYKIFIFDNLDKLYLETRHDKNFYFINPLKQNSRNNTNIKELQSLEEFDILECFSSLESIEIQDIKSLIDIQAEEEKRVVFRGLKKMTSNKEYKKLSMMIYNNLIISSCPILDFEGNVLKSKSILSTGNYFPIEIMYYLNNNIDGDIYYTGNRNFEWFDKALSIKDNKIKLSNYLKQTKDIKEILEK